MSAPLTKEHLQLIARGEGLTSRGVQAKQAARTALYLYDENERLREVLHAALPSLGHNARSYAQRALIDACALIGSEPEYWTSHPDVLAQVEATEDSSR